MITTLDCKGIGIENLSLWRRINSLEYRCIRRFIFHTRMQWNKILIKKLNILHHGPRLIESKVWNWKSANTLFNGFPGFL